MPAERGNPRCCLCTQGRREEGASQPMKQANVLVGDRAQSRPANEPTRQKRGSEASGRASERMRMAEWPNERNERPPCRNETSGGRASEANEAGLRSRRKQTRQTTDRTSERLRGGGWAEKYRAAHQLAERLLEAELTQKSDAFSCARARTMIKSKTSEHDGAAEPTRPVGWLAEGAACAPARHNPPGAEPLGGGRRLPLRKQVACRNVMM